MAKSKKILIIEDDELLRRVITKKLSLEGFEIMEAIDGEEGLRMIREHKPELVLLDLVLPGIDGFDVLAKMQTERGLSSIPVIILSNLGQKEDVQRGLKLGAVDYLIKAHFTLGEVITKIENVLK